jgi:hypothetical protein
MEVIYSYVTTQGFINDGIWFWVLVLGCLCLFMTFVFFALVEPIPALICLVAGFTMFTVSLTKSYNTRVELCDYIVFNSETGYQEACDKYDELKETNKGFWIGKVYIEDK